MHDASNEGYDMFHEAQASSSPHSMGCIVQYV